MAAPCGGVAVLSLTRRDVVKRGPLKGAGRWTHFYADPGNTACSQEKLVRGALSVQWFGRPGPRNIVDRHNRGLAPLYANGLMFVPGYDYIACVDAYNGSVLWERALAGSARAIALKNCGNMAAADDVLYVAAGDRCLAFDAISGKVERKFDVPSAGGDWGYVACEGTILFGSRTKPGASKFTLSPDSWKAAYSPLMPVVCSDSLFAYDRASGKRRWRYAPSRGVIANPSLAVGGDRIYFIESTNPETRKVASGRVRLPELLGKGAVLVALKVQDGQVAWKRPVELPLQHALYLSFAEGKIVVSGTKVAGRRINYDLHAFDASSGRPLWNIVHVPADLRDVGGGHGEITHHLVIVGETIYLCEAAFNLLNGRRLPKWRWSRGGHGCGTISSSATALFYRGTNPQMTELARAARAAGSTSYPPAVWCLYLRAAPGAPAPTRSRRPWRWCPLAVGGASSACWLQRRRCERIISKMLPAGGRISCKVCFAYGVGRGRAQGKVVSPDRRSPFIACALRQDRPARVLRRPEAAWLLDKET
ncbi:MAG: outer membrane protein assembly factor BamB family protein [Planctomycetota bacterium]